MYTCVTVQCTIVPLPSFTIQIVVNCSVTIVYYSLGFGLVCSNGSVVNDLPAFFLLLVMFLLLITCLCVGCCDREEQETFRTFCYIIAFLLGVMFLGLVILNSFFAFTNTFIKSPMLVDDDCDTKLNLTLLVLFSYGLIAVFIISWMCFLLPWKFKQSPMTHGGFQYIVIHT